jgi:alpha/beta superfamily hydrolase
MTTTQPVSFTADGYTLEGILSLPESPSKAPGLVICHPHPLYGGDMQNNVVRALAEAFAMVGYAVLRFNFRGVGRSQGRYGEGIGERSDAQAALAWLSAQPGVESERLFLAGYSFGARVALAVAAADPLLRGCIAVAPPVRRGDWPDLGTFHRAKLIIGGDRDPYAPPEILSAWVEGLPDPKRLVIFPGADHFFRGYEGALGEHAVKLLHELC